MLLDFLNTIQAGFVSLPAAGLSDVWHNVRDNYLAYIFFGGVAFLALVFLRDRAFIKLALFVLIAAIIGVLIFKGEDFFGSEGKVTGAVDETANQFNMIMSPDMVSPGFDSLPIER